MVLLFVVKLNKIKFKAGKEPSLLLIQSIAKKQPAPDWNKKNNFTLSWAKEVRILFRKNKINRKHMRNKQSKKFLLYIKWVTEYMKTHDRISYLLAKQKHTQLIAEIKSSRTWSHFSRRVRARVHLDYLWDRSKPKGDAQHFWIKK